MFKKIVVTIFLLSGLSAFASDNYLNSVVISNDDGKMSVVLRSDEVTKIKKEVESSDKIVLTLKGIKQAEDINTLYKNASEVDGLVIQNAGNELKLYIDAPNISKANIVFETPNSAPITVNDVNGTEKTVWSIISLLLVLGVIVSARNLNVEEEVQKDVNEIIKEREKALYRNFQREVATLPSMNHKLKSYRKHVLKGETIRSYENRLSKVS